METTLRPLTLGEILDRTAELYRNNFVLFAGIFAPYAGVALVLNLLLIGLGILLKNMHITTAAIWITLGTGALEMLILFLLYLGVIALWRTVEDPSRAARAVAILTLVGAIDLPIIKFSVEWWNTLHQPASVFRMDGPTIAPELLWPLLVMALAFTCLFLTLHVMAIRNEILRRRLARLTMLAAFEGDTARALEPQTASL